MSRRRADGRGGEGGQARESLRARSAYFGFNSAFWGGVGGFRAKEGCQMYILRLQWWFYWEG